MEPWAFLSSPAADGRRREWLPEGALAQTPAQWGRLPFVKSHREAGEDGGVPGHRPCATISPLKAFGHEQLHSVSLSS